MEKPLVIIHGWSDHAQSFRPLAERFAATLPQRSLQQINLADYISLIDQVTYDDLAAALQQAWTSLGLPTDPHSVDAIVHSTGALVLRHWLVSHYSAVDAPIGQLLMLAPANFGSPLAHKGRAFIGRLFKGLGHGRPFEVGENLLRGLELASPYTWWLAEQDLFVEQAYYHAKGIRCTILIGNQGYSGLAAAANEVGSDGTVRVACANLNTVKVKADFSQQSQSAQYQLANADCAFGVIDGLNHRSLISGEVASPIFGLMCRALTVDEAGFLGWQLELAAANELLLEQGEGQAHFHGYQNTVFRVNNQYTQSVDDYFLEFTDARQHNHWFAQMFHEEVVETVHTNQQASAYRSVYLNSTVMQRHVPKEWQHLHIGLTAFPQITDPHNWVGYRSIDADVETGMRVDNPSLSQFLQPNRTVLVDVTIQREQQSALLRLLPCES